MLTWNKRLDNGSSGGEKDTTESHDKLLIYNEVWRRTGKVGIGSERRKEIPMGIVLEDGSLCKDREKVLAKWKIDYEGLYNGTSDGKDAVYNVVPDKNVSPYF